MNAATADACGAQGRIRTTDTRIFSPLLYQLSYLGIATGGDALGTPSPRYSQCDDALQALPAAPPAVLQAGSFACQTRGR